MDEPYVFRKTQTQKSHANMGYYFFFLSSCSLIVEGMSRANH